MSATAAGCRCAERGDFPVFERAAGRSRASRPVRSCSLCMVTITVTFLLGELAVWICGDVETAGSAYTGVGAGAVPVILVYAFIRTVLSEAILFRGFLLKRLAAKLGFWKGNVTHAAIFGAAHLLMAWGRVGALAGAVVMIYPMAAALLLGHLDEKLSDGSIIPSWIVHGAPNTIEAPLQAF